MIGSMMRRAMLGDGSTLNLDFTTGVLDPRLTFTRAANTATVINSSGLVQTVNADVPRFDHDPTTLAPKGLLIEATATNLCLQSAEVRTSPWTTTSLTTAGASITAPDGTANGVEVVPALAAAINGASITQQITVSASTAYTISMFLKAKGTAVNPRLNIQARAGTTTLSSMIVNFSNTDGTLDAINSGTWTATSATSTNVGNGWYRVTFTGTTPATTDNIRVLVLNKDIGDGVNGWYAWGAQVEAGSGASSYIPTTASQGTRNADECSMTGSNFSSWFTNSAEGSFYAKYSMNNPAAFFGASVDRYAFEVSNSAGTSRVFTNASYRVSTAGNAGRFPRVFDLGTIDLAPSFVATAAQNTALAWGYKTNDNHLAAVGVTATDNSGTLQTGLDRIHIGASRSFAATSFLNGCITQLKYWPTRLPDATLQSLTT